MAVNPKSLENLAKGKRFEPGKTGNPSGRGVLEGLIRRAMEENDHEKLKTVVDTLYAEGVIGSARSTKDGETYYVKNMEAIKILLERGYGKVVQPIETPEGGLIIQIIDPTKQAGEDGK